MRAVLLSETGGPEVLKMADVPVPVPGAGQVLLRTAAIGVGYYELGIRSGRYPVFDELPARFGFEAVGTITEVGDDVDTALVGTRVAVMSTTGGAYAEYLVASAEAITPVPAGVSDVDAVAAAVPGSIALALLRRAKAEAETALVEAAGSGGVGSYLVQLAHEHGISHLTATAGSEAKRRLAAELGADLVLDHGDPQWMDKVPRGLGVVFESIGGETAKSLLTALSPGTGRMLFYGFLSGDLPAIGPMDLLVRGLTFTGCGGPDAWVKLTQDSRGEIFDLLARGRIRALVHTTMPLEEAVKAHELVESHAVLGKVILLP